MDCTDCGLPMVQVDDLYFCDNADCDTGDRADDREYAHFDSEREDFCRGT